jgi:hypothetical protein
MRGTNTNYTKVLVLFGAAGTLVVAVTLPLNAMPFRSSLWLAALPSLTFALLLVLTMPANGLETNGASPMAMPKA